MFGTCAKNCLFKSFLEGELNVIGVPFAQRDMNEEK